MQGPIKRDKPEFSISWTETIIMTILLGLAEWMFFITWENYLAGGSL